MQGSFDNNKQPLLSRKITLDLFHFYHAYALFGDRKTRGQQRGG